MLAELLNSPQGQGLLAAAFGMAASARRGAPWNTVGAGGLAGLTAFGNAQDRITAQQNDALRQQYMKAQAGRMDAETQGLQRKTQQADDLRKWFDTQDPWLQATGGSLSPTTDNAQRIAQVDPRLRQMWGAAKHGALPLEEFFKATAPQKPQQKVVGNTLLEVSDKGVKPLWTQPAELDPNKPFNLVDGQIVPNDAYQKFALGKARAGASSTSVSYGAPVAGLDAQGRPVFFQPGRDGGEPKIVPGVQPPKLGDEMRAADEARAKDLQTVDASIAVLDKALTHPGRAAATGMSRFLDPRNAIPSTDARDYIALADQIQGKAFLQAFESLKGGGQITEVEGRKATDAIARLDRSQSDAEYETALSELRDVMTKARNRINAGMRRSGGASGSYQGDAASQPPASSLQDAARAELERRRKAGGR